MEFVTVQTEDWIEQLKCFKCENFLSYFPIFTTRNNESICGRCSDPTENNTRNEIYEVVAQKIKFPCRYMGEGCFDKFVPEDVPHHELHCSFKSEKCPTHAFTNCNTRVSYHNLITHCQQQHGNHFLKNGQFEISLTCSEQSYNLLEHNDQLFIIRRKFRIDDSLFQIYVAPFGNAEQINLPFKVRLICGGAELLIKGDTKTSVKEIFLNSLVNQKYKLTKITGKVFLTKKASSPEVAKSTNNAGQSKYLSFVEGSMFPSISSKTAEGLMNPRPQAGTSGKVVTQKGKERAPFYLPNRQK